LFVVRPLFLSLPFLIWFALTLTLFSAGLCLLSLLGRAGVFAARFGLLAAVAPFLMARLRALLSFLSRRLLLSAFTRLRVGRTALFVLLLLSPLRDQLRALIRL